MSKPVAKSAPKTGELKLYTEIGGMGISAQDFSEAVKALGEVQEITLRVNSPGGDVFQAHGIFSQIKDHPARVIAIVDGIAASAASMVLMAADHVIMRENAMIMIHNAWTSISGDAKAIRKEAGLLDKFNDGLIDIYQARTGQPRSKISAWMDEETWLDAEEAVKLGFANEIKGSTKVKAAAGKIISNGIAFDASHFSHLPEMPQAQQEELVNQNNTMQEKQKEVEQPQAKVVEPVMNLDVLKAQHKEVYASAYAEGVEAERARIAELEEMDSPATHEIIVKAKKEGKSYAEVSKDIVKALISFKPAVVEPKVEQPKEEAGAKAFLAEAQKDSQTMAEVSSDNRQVTPVDKRSSDEEQAKEILKRVFAAKK